MLNLLRPLEEVAEEVAVAVEVVEDKMNRTELIIIIAIVAVFLLGGIGMIFNSGYSGYGMMGGYNYGMMSGFFFFGWIFMLLIVIALVLFILWLIRELQGGKQR
jgi:hypothetical protein